MKLTINYNISEILDKVNNKVFSPDIEYLYKQIEQYQLDMNKRIEESAKKCNESGCENKMRWIQENVEADIRHYVRQYINNQPVNVLKRINGKWKTVSDIGVKVYLEERKSVDYSEWFEYWGKHAERLERVNLPVFETHAHYNLDNYRDIYGKLIAMMKQSGIDNIVIPAVDFNSCRNIKSCFDLAEYDFLKYSFGSHPKYIWKEIWDNEKWDDLSELLDDPKCVALGECGLDYSYNGFCADHRDKQLALFNQFIDMANNKQLPVILHIRPVDEGVEVLFDADKDALEVLRTNHIKNGAVLHCFGGTSDDVEKYMQAGVTHFGIGGRICYGHKELEEAVRNMPEQCIVLETDSPYIRVDVGRMPNTSFSLYDIAQKIAELRNKSLEHILKVTYENAKRLYKL